MKKQHRLYLLHDLKVDWQIAGTSDIYKKGRSVPYVFCKCERNQDHEDLITDYTDIEIKAAKDELKKLRKLTTPNFGHDRYDVPKSVLRAWINERMKELDDRV